MSHVERTHDETSRLFSSMEQRRHGTVRSSTFNLTASAMGAGILVLPFSFQSSGLVLGFLLLLLFGLAAQESFNLLEESCRLAKTPIASFEDIAAYYWGQPMKKLVQLSLIVLLFGALVIFLVLSSDNIVPVSQMWIGSISRNAAIVISSLCILPLCLVDELHALRHTSFIVLVCIAYVFAIITIQFIHQWIQGDLPPIRYVNFNHQTLYTFSVHSLAYCSQFNVLPLFSELKNPTRNRMNSIKRRTIAICMVILSLFGGLGYLSFGQKTPGDILTAFDSSNPYVAVGRLALGISLLLKCPLVLHPLRLSIAQFSIFQPYRHRSVVLLTTIALLLPATALAILVPQIQTVYSALGATAGGMICFLLPAVIYLGTPASKTQKIRAWLILLLGIISIGASVLITIH